MREEGFPPARQSYRRDFIGISRAISLTLKSRLVWKWSLTGTINTFIYKQRYLACGLPWWLSGKESTCQCKRLRFSPWIQKILQRRKWQPTPVFLPGKSHGERSLEGYRPWSHKRVGHDLETKQQHLLHRCSSLVSPFCIHRFNQPSRMLYL